MKSSGTGRGTHFLDSQEETLILLGEKQLSFTPDSPSASGMLLSPPIWLPLLSLQSHALSLGSKQHSRLLSVRVCKQKQQRGDIPNDLAPWPYLAL